MQVNNKYIGDRFSPRKESCYLQYLDAKNLYGWAMPLVKWVKNLGKLEGCNGQFTQEAEKGYLLKADVSYPNYLHDLHSDLPFMCEKRKINRV